VTSHDSLWFRSRHTPRKSRLLQALPAPGAMLPAPPAPPGPPSVDSIMGLVRTYGEVLIDTATAYRMGYDTAYRQSQHRAEGLFELIEHNISTLDGWITGYRLVLSDLQKGNPS
jgi:hypothetical protein